MFEDMKIGMCVPHDTSLHVAKQWWRQMDEAGFDTIGIADTPMLCREVYLSLATAAAECPRAKLMLMISNPITRDVSVTAGSMLALRDLAGDRFTYGFGIGDSAVMGVGLQKAKIAQVTEYIQSLRDILGARTATHQGRALKAAWREWEPFRPPLMMGVGGEKYLRVAGQVADVIITTYGVLPTLVEKATSIIHEGAVEAGRDPSEIEVWHLVTVMPGETLKEGFANINLLTQAKLFALHGDRGVGRPPAVQEALLELAPHYSIDHHSRTNDIVWEVAERTGTVDWFVEQAGGMVGPSDYTQSVERMRAAGVRNLMLVGLGPDKPRLIEAIAKATVGRRRAA